MTKELSRTSALASRHSELGSGLEDWNGMGTAWTYNTDPNDEHDAVRERAGMFDMSPLKKVFIRGSDALQVVDHVFSRDATKIGAGQSAYGSVLTDRGTVCDDAIVANNRDGEWMLVHGSGESMERLQESARGRDATLELDDDLHDISVQGPEALAILDRHASIDLGKLRYFEHAEAELFGHKCRLSRTGYSGERGYEIFAGSGAVCGIWDQLADEGVLPCSFTALDKVRIEAALLFFGYDMTSEHTPWEVGLGFTINLGKADYRGKEAVAASRGSERFVAAGVVADHTGMLAGGETLTHQGEAVGTVNSPCWSHRMKKSLALVHIRPDAAKAGTELVIQGEGMSCSATVEKTPFYDPEKRRTHD